MVKKTKKCLPSWSSHFIGERDMYHLINNSDEITSVGFYVPTYILVPFFASS